MTRLNYHHLYYFWRVAKQGNLTATAEKLAISQSALSSQINQLEHSIGQPLFAREGRTLVLTELGHTVLNYAEDIFQRGEELQQLLKRGVTTLPSLRIGMLSSMSRNFIESFIEPLLSNAARDAGASFRLLARPQPELLDLLAQHQIDVVLTNREVSVSDDVAWQSQLLSRQPLSVIAPASRTDLPDHISPAYRAQQWVVPGSASPLRTAFEGFCTQHQLEPDIIAEVDDMAMLRLLARDSGALAAMPAVVVRDELRSGILSKRFELPNAFENFYAVTLSRKFQHPLLPELLQFPQHQPTTKDA
ncbi:LysR family transcriptional regulator [Pseudidiomarina insulisalsae]|uniref:LysR family transcriptional regulator n=1 Tax=Pseudidiomarina insulisalsae TaxID=575789 RepID=A0A432YMK0_9GAMM|nr:LysR family transcriptional regulator [Pseudidiomarina insulisalsae]RUO62194.1 LysR family transcriptional regulator [Pseudidiomarina insulisalsae]